MFNVRSRVSVVQHLKLVEFENANRENPDEVVVWVSQHKTGLHRPATVVMDHQLTDLMDR